MWQYSIDPGIEENNPWGAEEDRLKLAHCPYSLAVGKIPNLEVAGNQD